MGIESVNGSRAIEDTFCICLASTVRLYISDCSFERIFQNLRILRVVYLSRTVAVLLDTAVLRENLLLYLHQRYVLSMCNSFHFQILFFPTMPDMPLLRYPRRHRCHLRPNPWPVPLQGERRWSALRHVQAIYFLA